ncbi:MAG TPA: MFS transporter [Pirellulales bacterium]|nr:MFS transporter [Pirellulales bacterium]
MDLRNRIGLYGSYFFGMAGIGFTLPYLPLYLGQKGMTDGQIGLVSTLAALAGLAQFPLGLWSDRWQWRKPFLLVSLGALATATVLLPEARNLLVLGLLVILFAENGICRAVVESLSGAEAATLAKPGEVGAALGALRFFKPIGIVAVALFGGLVAEREGVASILAPVAIVQGLAFAAAWLIHDQNHLLPPRPATRDAAPPAPARQALRKDKGLMAFVAAMVLFHLCNAPGGVYLGLYLKRELHAPERLLSYAFVVSMLAWMLVVRPAGRLADRWGRRPLLIFCWATMSVRLALVALARSPWEVVAVQALDGLAGGLFSVLAAAWVTDRLGDGRRVSEAQVIVGTSLVFGSAVGPALSGLIVESLGYRGLFGLLAAVGAAATALVVVLVPETLVPVPQAAEHAMLHAADNGTFCHDEVVAGGRA